MDPIRSTGNLFSTRLNSLEFVAYNYLAPHSCARILGTAQKPIPKQEYFKLDWCSSINSIFYRICTSFINDTEFISKYVFRVSPTKSDVSNFWIVLIGRLYTLWLRYDKNKVFSILDGLRSHSCNICERNSNIW